MTGRAERPWRDAPKAVIALAVIAFVAQIALGITQARPTARASELGPPPTGAAHSIMRGFEPLPSAHALALYLQAFDNQPGISIPFAELDYERVGAWLKAILALDAAGQYPLLMASQLYAQVPDDKRRRFMLEFAYSEFFADPDRRWRWLAHGAIMAKHRLNDIAVALKFARAIAEHSRAAPSWARQMHIFLLEDLGELEAARILLGGLLASGAVTDRHEQLLLTEALARIKSAETSTGATKK